jgi:AraC-like DNA-binding protein
VGITAISILKSLPKLLFELQPYSTQTERAKENADYRITQQFKNALVQHIYEKQSVSNYADLLAVTPDHLNNCVKAATGKTARDLLCDMVMMEAKALLRQTALSISELVREPPGVRAFDERTITNSSGRKYSFSKRKNKKDKGLPAKAIHPNLPSANADINQHAY